MEFVYKCRKCGSEGGCELADRITDAIEELEDDYPSVDGFDDIIIIGSKKFFWDGRISETDYSCKISCGVLKRASDEHLKWIITRLYFDTGLNDLDEIYEGEEEDDDTEEESWTTEDGEWQGAYDDADNLTRAQMRLERVSEIRYPVEVKHSREINAYAYPEGKIKVTSAAAERLSESELAFVIGHEETHLDEKHHECKSALLGVASEAISDLLKDEEAGIFKKLLGALFIGVATMAIASLVSKAHELSADFGGKKRMVEAGYPEDEAADIFDRIGPNKGSYFSSHPTAQFRKKLLRD